MEDSKRLIRRTKHHNESSYETACAPQDQCIQKAKNIETWSWDLEYTKGANDENIKDSL